MEIWQVNIDRNRSEVDGISTAIQGYTAALEGKGVRTRVVEFQGPILSVVAFAARSGLRAWREKPDCVHLHSVYRPGHVVLGFVLRLGRINYVVSPHSGLSVGSRSRQKRIKAVWIAAFERRLLRRSAGVGVLSPVEADDVAEICPPARTSVIGNSISEVTGARLPEPAPSRGPVLLSLSRFDVTQKGLDRLALLAGQLPEADVHVYGAPDHNDPEAIERLAAVAPPNFHLEEPIRGEAKWAALQRADYYVQLSRWEGLSLSVLEALAFGTPCLVSEYVARTLGPELASLVTVLPEDPVEAAQIVRGLAGRRAELVAEAARARDIVRRLFSVEAVADDLLALYA